MFEFKMNRIKIKFFIILIKASKKTEKLEITVYQVWSFKFRPLVIIFRLV